MKGWDRWADLPKIKVKTLTMGARYDEMDPILHAQNIDAERALAVFALLNFRRLAADNAG